MSPGPERRNFIYSFCCVVFCFVFRQQDGISQFQFTSSVQRSPKAEAISNEVIGVSDQLAHGGKLQRMCG